MIRLALKPLNIQPKFEITNWARSFQNAKTGAIDALIPTIHSHDREEFFIFPEEPLAILKMVLIGRADDAIPYNGSLESIKGYTVGRIRNARVSPAFDAAAMNGIFHIDDSSRFELLALGVVRGRIDLMAGY